MTDLHLALIAFGVVLVAAVLIYNALAERRARGKAEKAFGSRPPDALFEDGGARREPTLGAFPTPEKSPEVAPRAQALDETVPPRFAAEELDASVAPAAEISSRIDTVAVILADDPIMSEQLQPLLAALETHPTPTNVEGIVDEQWHPIDTSPRRSWRELRVGLQLASRRGAVGEEQIERFNRAIADFAAAVSAVSQREAPTAAAARARELDGFCADTDVEVAMNVIGLYGATFAISRVKALALDNGLSETAAGDLVRYTPDGHPGFVIRKFDDPHAKHTPTYYTGLTFALDLPNVADGPRMLTEMVRVAETFAATLGGQLVDDNRKPLTEAGIASIRRSLEGIVQKMESQGIPAGGALARRLFS
ncbi:MAG: cell division protein ZipA C-terminal FtsZ-binding domain-containing protein [Usitatibacter sp.]